MHTPSAKDEATNNARSENVKRLQLHKIMIRTNRQLTLPRKVECGDEDLERVWGCRDVGVKG